MMGRTIDVENSEVSMDHEMKSQILQVLATNYLAKFEAFKELNVDNILKDMKDEDLWVWKGSGSGPVSLKVGRDINKAEEIPVLCCGPRQSVTHWGTIKVIYIRTILIKFIKPF